MDQQQEYTIPVKITETVEITITASSPEEARDLAINKVYEELTCGGSLCIDKNIYVDDDDLDDLGEED